MGCVIEYCELKRNIRILRWVVTEIHDIVYKVRGPRILENYYFDYLEESLNGLKKYPTISNLKTFHSLMDAVRVAKSPMSTWEKISGKNKEIASKMILENFKPVLTEAMKISEEIKPPKDLTKKEAIAQTIRKIREQEEALDRDLKKLEEISELYAIDWEKLWISTYNVHRTKLLEMINELKSLDPALECEDEFAYAKDELSYVQDSQLYGKENIEHLMESRKLIGSLIGKVRAEYNITEEEKSMEKVSPTKQAVEVIKTTETPLVTFPKYKELLEALENLAEKELPAKLGLNRPVSDVQEVLNETKRNLTVYLFQVIGIERKDSLEEDDEEIWFKIISLEKHIKNKPKDGKLTEDDLTMFREFSYNLRNYVKNKMEEQKSALI